jgi:hypothetical protein
MPAAFDIGHKLVGGAADVAPRSRRIQLVVSAGMSLKELLGWIQRLPE